MLILLKIYNHHSAVGGEHEAHYYILGILGDSLHLQITSEDPYMGHIMTRDGINIRFKQWDSEIRKMTYIIDVSTQHVWIDVSFSAHPYADYYLQVSKQSILVQ